MIEIGNKMPNKVMRSEKVEKQLFYHYCATKRLLKLMLKNKKLLRTYGLLNLINEMYDKKIISFNEKGFMLSYISAKTTEKEYYDLVLVLEINSVLIPNDKTRILKWLKKQIHNPFEARSLKTLLTILLTNINSTKEKGLYHIAVELVKKEKISPIERERLIACMVKYKPDNKSKNPFLHVKSENINWLKEQIKNYEK